MERALVGLELLVSGGDAVEDGLRPFRHDQLVLIKKEIFEEMTDRPKQLWAMVGL